MSYFTQSPSGIYDVTIATNEQLMILSMTTMALPRKLLTLAFLVRERAAAAPDARGLMESSREVLLGEKKRGFGLGKWNGFGGKVEASDSSIAAAAAREVQEEANVAVDERDLEPRGVLTFSFEGGKELLVCCSVARWSFITIG